MTNELAHSNEVGGSSVPKRLNCHLSRSLEAEAPKRPSSDFADRGSMLHAVMELLLTNNVENIKQAQPLINEAVGQDFGFKGHPLTDDLVADKIQPALIAWWQVCKDYDIVDFMIEVRVSLDHIIPGAFGTADIIAVDSDGRLHILDWKFGDGVPVPVEGNVSTGFYAAGALNDQEDDDLADMLDGNLVEDCPVIMHIVQPRTGFDDDPLQSWETTETWVENLLIQLTAAMLASYEPDPQPKAGDWCKWCDAAPICPAQQTSALAAVKKDPHGMTGVELAKWLDVANQLEKWKNQLFEFALNEMEGGATVPGYKLVNKRATRKWNEPDEVEAICKKKRLKIDQIYNKQLKSPAQLEKSAKNVYSKVLKDMVVSVSSGVTLVPDSDKRPAVTSSIELLANALPANSEDN